MVSVMNLAETVSKSLEEAQLLYHRLIVLAAPAGSGKTAVLRTVHERTGAPLLNVNLELSQRLLELGELERILETPKILADIVQRTGSDTVLLDNIELLFDASLRQDPLRLLQRLSRSVTIVAAWNGAVCQEPSGTFLVYATPGHQEYRKYPVKDFLTVSPEQNS